MVDSIKSGPGLRIVFERCDRTIHTRVATDGVDAKDVALLMLGRFDELEPGDRIYVSEERN